ncbi:MAG: hypothetical protein AVDCRST_MAG95-1372, partial [uncultured Adhaeribacter sp.]
EFYFKINIKCLSDITNFFC